MGLDEFDEGYGFDLAKEGRETKVFGKVTVEYELKTDVMESHELVELHIVVQALKIGKPPPKPTPLGAMVFVDA